MNASSGKFEILLNGKVIGGATLTDSSEPISGTNKTSEQWVEPITESTIGKPTYSIELEAEINDESRANLDKIVKEGLMNNVKYHNEIMDAFGEDAEELLTVIGKTMQQASDELQEGVNMGYSIESQVEAIKAFLSSVDTAANSMVLAAVHVAGLSHGS